MDSPLSPNTYRVYFRYSEPPVDPNAFEIGGGRWGNTNKEQVIFVEINGRYLKSRGKLVQWQYNVADAILADAFNVGVAKKNAREFNKVLLHSLATERTVNGIRVWEVDQHAIRSWLATESRTNNLGCLIGLLILGGIIALLALSSRNADKLGPSDDPYYDAPTGQTRGGDTF